jgi:hypothetical protein
MKFGLAKHQMVAIEVQKEYKTVQKTSGNQDFGRSFFIKDQYWFVLYAD